MKGRRDGTGSGRKVQRWMRLAEVWAGLEGSVLELLTFSIRGVDI